MQHIKRINESTFRVTIGERVLEAICSYNTEPVTKIAVQRYLAGNPAPNCRVTDITERLRIEAESALISSSREIGCTITERFNEHTLLLRHPFGLVHASWSRRNHNWTLSTDRDVYVCDPDAVSVKKALTFLLDAWVNEADSGSVAQGFLIALLGWAVGIICGLLGGYYFL